MIAASPDALPNDLDALRAVVLAERAEKRLLIEERDAAVAERDQLNAANEKLHHIIAVLRRARFGRKSERLSEDQLDLVLEELETASAKAEAEEEKKDENLKRERAKKRRANRGALPAHLQRIEQVIEPESTACPCCGKAMHVIGEDKSERLDKMPAVLRVIVTRRPKYGCKCEEAVVQAPAPPRLIEGGIPTESACRRCRRVEIRRSPAAVPPGANLFPPRHPSRPLDARGLGGGGGGGTRTAL